MLSNADVGVAGALAQLRLMQLVSPSLPVGAYSYSQGLESAVHAGWVKDESTFVDWSRGLLHDSMHFLELPILIRLYNACQSDDLANFSLWSQRLLASRETRELRDEERHRARALCRLLNDLQLVENPTWLMPLKLCQVAPFAFAATRWQIGVTDTLLGYAWSWLENQTAAGIKLIPLGQTAGQRVMQQLSLEIVDVTNNALCISDDEIGASAPAQALASCLHETQYSRLFRS